MVIPGIAWMIVFCYIPMFWLIIAFMDYSVAKPMLESPFVGLKHFEAFTTDDRFWRSIRNTLGMSSIKLVLGFSIPIVFALLLNEIRSLRFKRTVQTISYLPHFIAWTIFGGIMLNWLSGDGLVNHLLMGLGLLDREVLFISEPEYFWWITFFSDTLKETGWAAIIYIAAIAGIDPALYEAAELDGANRWKRMWHITIQCIRPTIAILFILAVAGILGSNFDQIFMLKNNMNIRTAESLDLYIYNMGLVSGRHSFSTAVLFARSIVALVLLFMANYTSKKLTGDSIF
ncbi:MAG: sugar ABC transporter permease [Cohnella sp.]|nr:sugar ABC transporter permease [Cohnella sp.]